MSKLSQSLTIIIKGNNCYHIKETIYEASIFIFLWFLFSCIIQTEGFQNKAPKLAKGQAKITFFFYFYMLEKNIQIVLTAFFEIIFPD